MKRYALLIEASKYPGSPDLKGAVADVQSFRSWLNSNSGGAWGNNEIETLSHPSWKNVSGLPPSRIMSSFLFLVTAIT
jgi:hypothetical protein